MLLRVSFRYPLRAGMLGCLVFAVPLLMLGLDPHVVPLVGGDASLAGAGMEVFGLGWNLAMQENVPEEMLSRAYSYDALGSFVAIPVGQLVYGPLGEWFGTEPRAGGQRRRSTPGICLLVLASPAGAQPRAAATSPEPEAQHHFCAIAMITVSLRLVATPSAFSTAAFLSVASW